MNKIIGKCQICKTEPVELDSQKYYYDIDCSCCKGDKHYETVWYCENCVPKPPETFKVELTVSLDPLPPAEDDIHSKANLCRTLRFRTGAGMMECKKALEESDWNLDKAEEWLRKQVRRKGI